MRLLITVLIFSLALADESQLDYIKGHLDKSKFKLVNVDKFLEIYNMEWLTRVRERMFGVFCRFDGKTNCRGQLEKYLGSYDKFKSQDQLSNLKPWALAMAAYKDTADCNKQLGSICVAKPCIDAGSALCTALFARPDAAKYAKEYVLFRDETKKMEEEWVRLTESATAKPI